CSERRIVNPNDRRCTRPAGRHGNSLGGASCNLPMEFPGLDETRASSAQSAQQSQRKGMRMSTQGPKLVSPATLADTFVSGPISMMSAPGMVILTFTQLRFDSNPGSPPVPDKAVAVARLVLPAPIAADLHKLLEGYLAKKMPVAGSA